MSDTPANQTLAGPQVQRYQERDRTDASQPRRLAEGGLVVDRGRRLSFRLDGRSYTGYAGDTLASALLAHGVKLVARSFKYHRPRGIYSAGVEEPNALVELRTGGRREPNTRATMAELYDGLEAHSQNRWPSLGFDVGEINNLLSPFFGAGFYYKTFMWPASFWEKYEVLIRRAAGMGSAARERDPDRYEHRNAHCEVLVVGGGPAGLAAARAAARSGQRVLLVDENPRLGGWLWRESHTVDGRPGAEWLAETQRELASAGVQILTRTTAFGYYDDNLMGCVERAQDHVAVPGTHLPRQRLWKIRARRVILATGSIEQPLVFPDNDRPGVMLAGAVRSYLHAYGVLAGRRVVLVTNNDDAYRTALDLMAVKAEVVVVDNRARFDGELPRQVQSLGVPILSGAGIHRVRGRLGVQGVEIQRLESGQRQRFECDLVAVSGGWVPTLHLHSQAGGKNVYCPQIAAFVPGAARREHVSIGAAAGRFGLEDCIRDGEQAGRNVTGQTEESVSLPAPGAGVAMGESREAIGGPGKCFLDLQHDVTLSDVDLAHREGFRSVEHVKRYTTLGMATDQGKTSNLSALSRLAGLRKQPIPEVGTTTFRPPYTPVTLGAIAGGEVGRHLKPLRRTPMDDWHAEHGVRWIDAGLWRRPHYYPQAGEDVDAAALREGRATRHGVGLCDVSPLGKIDIQGPDAAEFLNRVYCNAWKKLPVGKARYGLMLREDGIVLDDGTTSRLAENHFHMTTTTANAVKVMGLLEYYLQVEWPGLRVQVTSVTEQWAGMSIAGPQSRRVLEKLVDRNIGNEAFPFMAVAECRIAGIPGRLFRISFSGELAYEVNVPADYGQAAWEALVAAGQEFDMVVYGIETLGALRVEKGHVAGPELDGRTTADDLGLGKLVKRNKPVFIGKAMLEREVLADPARPRLVGLKPADGRSWIRAGSQLIADPAAPLPMKMLGHVTSIAYSPELGHPIALALLSGGLEREGETLYAAFPLKGEMLAVTVTSPHFVDPDGSRMYV